MIPILDKELVKSVKWEDGPETFDERLCRLGQDHAEFLIINPLYDDQVLSYINVSEKSNKCIVWYFNGQWVAKKYSNTWKRSNGWRTFQVDIPLEVEWNNDLPRVFSEVEYELDPNDLLLEHVWYLDSKFYKEEKIWVKKAKYFSRTLGTKDMGNLTPNIAQELAVVFISYDEPDADSNWQKVLKKAPHAKRVHGVKGIFEAHKAAAELSDTNMFYVVDGDAELVDTFNFSFVPSIFDLDVVHVWHSSNPINGLEYGYGGVKLFPKRLITEAETWGVDMTTSLGNKLKVINKVSNITTFNTDPFSTWKSAFRECVKLAAGTIESNLESDLRLHTWTTIGKEQPYGEHALAGAHAGKEFGLKNKNNIEELKKINDRRWLQEQFNLSNKL
jgi:hypothetical protein